MIKNGLVFYFIFLTTNLIAQKDSTNEIVTMLSFGLNSGASVNSDLSNFEIIDVPSLCFDFGSRFGLRKNKYFIQSSVSLNSFDQVVYAGKEHFDVPNGKNIREYDFSKFEFIGIKLQMLRTILLRGNAKSKIKFLFGPGIQKVFSTTKIDGYNLRLGSYNQQGDLEVLYDRNLMNPNQYQRRKMTINSYFAVNIGKTTKRNKKYGFEIWYCPNFGSAIEGLYTFSTPNVSYSNVIKYRFSSFGIKFWFASPFVIKTKNI